MAEEGDTSLSGRTIALPETRELDLFASMLEKRGAAVVRCPMVAIHDAPHAAPVEAWLRELIAGRFDDVIFFTGEGIRRLRGFAERAGLHQAFVEALSRVRRITRGPKPVKALRDIGLKPDLKADQPTTDGVIATLGRQDLRGRTTGVQLYGTEPNEKLMAFLREAGAEVRPVWPYIYASRAEDERVAQLIGQLAGADGQAIDCIAFTSMAQVERLWSVAAERGLEAPLRAGLQRTKVAAVGPVVADELARRQVRIDAMPAETFALKPLTQAIVAMLGAGGAG
jgi:uroporphyrinogen-III synthase